MKKKKKIINKEIINKNKRRSSLLKIKEKENENPNSLETLIPEIKNDFLVKNKRQSLGRRVSFSTKVDVRHIYDKQQISSFNQDDIEMVDATIELKSPSKSPIIKNKKLIHEEDTNNLEFLKTPSLKQLINNPSSINNIDLLENLTLEMKTPTLSKFINMVDINNEENTIDFDTTSLDLKTPQLSK